MIRQLFAGIGLGLLVGLLLGLSSSPVVSLVVGALATGMVTLLGFVRSNKDPESAYTEGSAIRLGSFGFSCAAAVLLGLCIRTYNWASPSVEEQVKKVQQAGYSADEARRWVAYRALGTVLDSKPSGTADSKQEQSHTDSQHMPVAASVLFSSGNSGQCQYFDTSRYKDTQEHLYALRQKGGTYAEYAGKISALDENQQKTVLDGLRLLFCPQ
jgi:hypothetical protein